MGAEAFERSFEQDYAEEAIRANDRFRDHQAAAFVEAEVYATEDNSSSTFSSIRTTGPSAVKSSTKTTTT